MQYKNGFVKILNNSSKRWFSHAAMVASVKPLQESLKANRSEELRRFHQLVRQQVSRCYLPGYRQVQLLIF